MNAIRRSIAVDWSGAAVGARRKIWLCEVEAGRVRRLEAGRSREELIDHLIEEAGRRPDFVVGLDFAFSFPAPFLRKRLHSEVATVWKEAALRGEDWLARCPNPPFWGKPGKRKPRFDDGVLQRRTEHSLAQETGAKPFSVFQIGGVGAVGVGSIRGMPLLTRLREAGFAIWPFDRPHLPLVVEIWPRIFIGAVRKSRPVERRRLLESRYQDLAEPFFRDAAESDDAFDALVSALEMDRYRPEMERLERAQDEVTALEGAIWRPREL